MSRYYRQNAMSRHWPEYLIEAGGLGAFMVSACLFGTLLFHPASPVTQAIVSPDLRRVLMGGAMALTNISLIYSPWGRQSGAHLNPAVTLTFYRLGKVAPPDLAGYVIAQFVGGCLGVAVAAALLGNLIRNPAVDYVVTVPGMAGTWIAFLAETVISFVLMSVVLFVSNRPRWMRYTGLCAALLVALYISVEAPLSGMSMNPARTFGSALAAHRWTDLWIYFTAPPLGMLSAAALYQRLYGMTSVFCAKLVHDSARRCIFCAYHQTPEKEEAYRDKCTSLDCSTGVNSRDNAEG